MFIVFFFNDTATTEIYTLSLHDALPIYARGQPVLGEEGLQRLRQGGDVGDLAVAQDAGAKGGDGAALERHRTVGGDLGDRKSTRLNSSHANISYAVFCLKKKKKHTCIQQ